ncbi:hypothetical protein H9X57_11080 [Flavobacterium piscinae]|uniref:Uncharacterized protein n=1 Tax=Flavobacterium piscinae TaxID=2506424 RepID=A0A4V1N4W3_9FLAO|nr:hypothetical protein [Flavobacterium piscinae]MBC8883710.1 hypothetical protein [Flavobacterium piscinae]RXR33566.1 hypothetical protein EQG68_04900 [Flavobacterium piscinae]
MAKSGDRFITTLKRAHLEWGSFRHTNSRGIIYGEGYLQIPAKEARRLNITNSNLVGGNNVYICSSTDGFLNNITLKSTGCNKAGDIYAKQFNGNGNLKLIGNWFSHINAKVGDQIEILWITSNKIQIRKL